MANLTPKQEKFCLKYVEVGNATEAYRFAYNAENMNPATVNRAAKDAIDNPKNAARIKELLNEQKEKHMVTVDQKKEWLKIVIERSLQAVPVLDSRGNPTGEYKFGGNDVVKAINELNKMDGDHAPAKKDLTFKDDYSSLNESQLKDKINQINERISKLSS